MPDEITERLLDRDQVSSWCADRDPTGRYVCRRIRNHPLDVHAGRNDKGGIHQWPVRVDQLIAELERLRESRLAWAIEADRLDAEQELLRQDRDAARRERDEMRQQRDMVKAEVDAERLKTESALAAAERWMRTASGSAAGGGATAARGWAVHPGEVLREELEHREITQAAFAEEIGRPAQLVSEIVNGKKSITAETALNFERVLGISADFWSRLQADYHLNVARARAAERLAPVSGSDTATDGGAQA